MKPENNQSKYFDVENNNFNQNTPNQPNNYQNQTNQPNNYQNKRNQPNNYQNQTNQPNNINNNEVNYDVNNNTNKNVLKVKVVKGLNGSNKNIFEKMKFGGTILILIAVVINFFVAIAFVAHYSSSKLVSKSTIKTIKVITSFAIIFSVLTIVIASLALITNKNYMYLIIMTLLTGTWSLSFSLPATLVIFWLLGEIVFILTIIGVILIILSIIIVEILKNKTINNI